MNVRVSTSVFFVCICVWVQNRRTNEWRLLRGVAVCKDIRRLRWRVNFLSPSLSLGTTLRAWLQARFSLLSFWSLNVLRSLSFYPILAWQETISYRRCIKMCVCLCVFFLSLCFTTSLSRALSHLLTFRFRCVFVCFLFLVLFFTNLPFVFIFFVFCFLTSRSL